MQFLTNAAIYTVDILNEAIKMEIWSNGPYTVSTGRIWINNAFCGFRRVDMEAISAATSASTF